MNSIRLKIKEVLRFHSGYREDLQVIMVTRYVDKLSQENSIPNMNLIRLKTNELLTFSL